MGGGYILLRGLRRRGCRGLDCYACGLGDLCWGVFWERGIVVAIWKGVRC